MATASTSEQLFSLLASNASMIRLAAGTYELDTQLEISTNVTLAAHESGLVVLQAQGASPEKEDLLLETGEGGL